MHLHACSLVLLLGRAVGSDAFVGPVRSNPFCFKPDPTTDISIAATDEARAAETSSPVTPAAPVAEIGHVAFDAADVTPAAATELLEALTEKKEGVDFVSLIASCEDSYDERSFDGQQILGDWRLKYQEDGKESQRSQKVLSGFPADSNFITDDKGRRVFRNFARLSKKRVTVVADVAYEISEDIPNRLVSDIVAAGITIQIGKRFGWRPLRIPLPLKGLGWLDVTYLDDKIRITRGNRGGLFVHVRPELVKGFN